MAKQADSQKKQNPAEDDRQKEANYLKAMAADWDGEKSDLTDIVNDIIDLSSEGKATETVKEICYDLRSHPSLPRLTWVELTNILAQIFIDEDDWDMADVWTDQANDTLDEIEYHVQSIFGEDFLDSHSNISHLREQLDDMIRDIAIHNGDCDSEDSEDVDGEEGEQSQ